MGMSGKLPYSREMSLLRRLGEAHISITYRQCIRVHRLYDIRSLEGLSSVMELTIILFSIAQAHRNQLLSGYCLPCSMDQSALRKQCTGLFASTGGLYSRKAEVSLGALTGGAHVTCRL